jgi:hypothetical protein
MLQHEEDDGMGDEVADEDKKTVEKSKIQHKSSPGKTYKGDKDDEMESKDDEGGDGDAGSESKHENLPQDESKDKETSEKKANKKQEDKKSNGNQDEQPNEGETKSDAKDLPKNEVIY